MWSDKWQSYGTLDVVVSATACSVHIYYYYSCIVGAVFFFLFYELEYFFYPLSLLLLFDAGLNHTDDHLDASHAWRAPARCHDSVLWLIETYFLHGCRDTDLPGPGHNPIFIAGIILIELSVYSS